MKAKITHTQKFTFEAKIRDHSFIMDTQQANGGDNHGPTPKELMLASVLGCTGMDIIAILKKNKMTPKRLTVTGDAEPRTQHPRVFESIYIIFDAEDASLSGEALTQAAHASLTKFCGVSAMVSKVVPIFYKVLLNGKEVGSGQASFEI